MVLPQNKSQLPAPILLPPIEIIPISKSIGIIHHRLKNGGLKQIISLSEVSLSAKIKERVYILDDGQKIIVTKRKKITPPLGIDGILFESTNGGLIWAFHKLIQTFNHEITAKGLTILSQEISESWTNQFTFIEEKRNKDDEIISKGLRPPQIGSLHAIGAHWSLYNHPATIVMPTGTGKTETMLAATVAYSPGRILLIVPSRVLKSQTAKKFINLGLLRLLKTIDINIKNPIVGIINKRPVSSADLEIFDQCNVVISTMSALAADTVAPFISSIISKIDTLIVDEAHHVAAQTWSEFREHFKDKKVLQFTATPYRRDGKLVDGKVIFNYPLHAAQNDGYFKKISFEAIHEIDEVKGDQIIAHHAVIKLKEDIGKKLDHLIMARCKNINRANEIHLIYQEIAAEYNPILVHSDGIDVTSELDRLKRRESRIVVCVDMLGEGFDLPQLKIAAVHDTHKSLAVLLQFTGRFTRVADNNIGEATIIANIANTDVSLALERLYSEDADWNLLLSEFSSEAAQAHAALIDFLNNSEKLGDQDDEEVEISHHLLRPALSTLIYRANSFNPEKFFEAIPEYVNVHRVWLHHESNTLYFVTRADPRLDWTRSQELRDRQWDLFVLHYNEEQELLYLASSDKTSTFEGLATTVGGKTLITGDNIFRSLGRISRLIFQNVGVRKHGRRNLSFAMYTGADVAQALTITEAGTSVKSNLSGTGWENGAPVSIGCSLKGRIWSRDAGTIPELVEFCEHVGAKVIDDSISTKDIIDNVLIPELVTTLPSHAIISIDWPAEIWRQVEERVILNQNGGEGIPITLSSIELVRTILENNQVIFRIFTIDNVTLGVFCMSINETNGFLIEQISEQTLSINIGRLTNTMHGYFSEYPPLIRFVDLSELDGNLLIRPQVVEEMIFPEEQITPWTWDGIDITKESIWKEGIERRDSIQWKVAQTFEEKEFDIIFDDDNAGEAADLICLKEQNEFIHLALIHCKFTTSPEPGERIKDAVEVCSQAIRSAKWKWKFQDLCRHIISREKRLTSALRPTRFISGTSLQLNKFMKMSKFKEIRVEIIIVQPGISKATITPDQMILLASTFSYLKETIGVDLELVCSY